MRLPLIILIAILVFVVKGTANAERLYEPRMFFGANLELPEKVYFGLDLSQTNFLGPQHVPALESVGFSNYLSIDDQVTTAPAVAGYYLSFLVATRDMNPGNASARLVYSESYLSYVETNTYQQNFHLIREIALNLWPPFTDCMTGGTDSGGRRFPVDIPFGMPTDRIDPDGWGGDTTLTEIQTNIFSAIDNIGRALQLIPGPFFLRVGFEANHGRQAYCPATFRRAYARVISQLRDSRYALRFASVWHVVPGEFPFMDFYPGDEYVDWIGISLYGDAFVNSTSGALYSQTTAILAFAENHLKPVFIVESSPIDYGVEKCPGELSTSGCVYDPQCQPSVPVLEPEVCSGSLESAGSAAWDAWFDPYFQLIADFPVIKGFTYGNTNHATQAHTPSWNKNALLNSPSLVDPEESNAVLSLWLAEMENDVFQMSFPSLEDYIAALTKSVTFTNYKHSPVVRFPSNGDAVLYNTEIQELGENLPQANRPEAVFKLGEDVVALITPPGEIPLSNVPPLLASPGTFYLAEAEVEELLDVADLSTISVPGFRVRNVGSDTVSMVSGSGALLLSGSLRQRNPDADSSIVNPNLRLWRSNTDPLCTPAIDDQGIPLHTVV